MLAQPFVLQSERVRVRPGVTVGLYLGRKLGRLSHTLLSSPAVWALAAVGAAVGAVGQIATWLAVSFALVLLVPLGFWATSFSDSFQTHVSGRARGTLRSLIAYRWRWAFGLKECGIIPRWRDAPLLLRTHSTPVVDRLRVKMVAGQTTETYAKAADAMAQTFGARACRVSAVPSKPHWIDLQFTTREPLVKDVRPYPPEPDWVHGLPIASQENGKPWLLKLVGSHLLLVGATGAGKSSVIWAIILALFDAIEDRMVRLWVLDPKGGMELAAGRDKFDRFVYGSDAALFANLLEEAVKVMQRRQKALMGKTRQHVPSRDDPLIVVVVDEMAALTAWSADKDAQRRIKGALQLLLSQGRAVGVTVIGAVQDPRKDTIPMRDLFPIRIALRLNEAAQVNMVLGAGALDAGAKCHEIPRSLRGVGYVMVDGDPMPYRVRFAHVTDDMIRGRQIDEADLLTLNAA